MSDSIAQMMEQVDAAHLCRGEVVALTESGAVAVNLDGDQQVRCEVLVTNDGAQLGLAPGDQVLTWVPPGGVHALVIGRIGPTHAAPPETATALEALDDDVPESLVLEAKHSLTLRVGDGSITIREDGKILIKGKDLVSHAQRLNRIKGGAVQIN